MDRWKISPFFLAENPSDMSRVYTGWIKIRMPNRPQMLVSNLLNHPFWEGWYVKYLEPQLEITWKYIVRMVPDIKLSGNVHNTLYVIITSLVDVKHFMSM